MAMVVRSNLTALNANRQLGMNNSQVAKSLEKLSSGYRINRAGDDASGLAISEKMKAQIKGLEQASSNAQDGISLVQTAEGAMTEVHNMLNRMTELATKSSNGTIQNEVDRENIQNEVNQLISEIDRIGDSTNFNGIYLLNGTMGGGRIGGSGTASGSKLTFTAAEGSTVKVDFDDATESSLGIIASKTGTNVVFTIGSKTTAGSYTAKDFNDALKKAGIEGVSVSLDKNMEVAIGHTTDLGPVTAAAPKYAKKTVGGIDFEATKAGNITSTVQVASAAGVEGVTVDKANGNVVLSLDSNKTYTAEDINKILSKGGAGVKATKVGTVAAGGAAALAGGAGLGASGLSLQVGDTNDSFNKVTVSIDDVRSGGLGISSLSVANETDAGSAIDTIKTAINKVSSNRGTLGALQNRLEYAINNLDVTAENMNSANSRIRDTDMAKEMMNYTKMNVLTQSAQAMLAQANQAPQSILQLLQ